MSLIGKIISGGQAGVDRGAIEAALELGFPYGGLIPKGRLAEDGLVPLKFSCMTEDTRKYSLHWAEQNIVNSDATLILSRTRELTGDTKRIEELCKKYGKSYWIDNPEQPAEWAQGLKLLYWIEEKFGERGIILNVAGSRESRDSGIQAATRSFVKRFLLEYGVNDPLPEVKIIGKSPFVKEDDDEGIFWSFKTVDPDDTEEERVFFTETAPRMLVRYKYNPIDRGPTTMTYFYDVINAFRNCSSLVEADMGAGLVSTFMGALTGCASLKTFRFPRYCTTLADDPFARCASLEGELDLGDTRRLHASASQLPFRDCPLLAKVRISRRLHDWLTQNADWYAANPNLGLPNGTVEIRD